MSNIIHQNPNFNGALPAAFAGHQVENDLSAGVSGGFGLVAFRGKAWSIRYQGNEQVLMREDGDGPRNSIEIVILKASTHLTKTWYETGYVEGSNAAPDCFSSNGVNPDPSSPKPQCNVCALCPKNAWGSAVNAQGQAGKGKACSDVKRLAIVPANDIRNEFFGGPLLLRVPPSSLQDMASFGTQMSKMGYPYFSYVTRISFDPSTPYPKLQFSALRPITDNAEAALVLEMQNHPVIAQILDESPVSNVAPGQTQQIQQASPFENGAAAGTGSLMTQSQQAHQPAQQAAQQQVQPQQVQPQQVQQAQQQVQPQQGTQPVQQGVQQGMQQAGGFGPVSTVAAQQPQQAQQQATQQVQQAQPQQNTQPVQQAGGFGPVSTVQQAQPQQTQPQQAQPQQAQPQQVQQPQQPVQEQAQQVQQQNAELPQAVQADAGVGSIPEDFDAKLDALLGGAAPAGN